MTGKELHEKSQREMKQYSLTVAKQNVAIQKARYSLSTQQQKILCYLISELKITDTKDDEKVFDIKDFYDFMEINSKNYDRVKTNLQSIRNKSWWIKTSDGWDTLISFFNTVKMDKRSGKVRIKFHEDMLPFLQELNAQNPYTRYKLFYIMTMKSQYSMRLYEILKSVEKIGNWSLSIDFLKVQLDCENYKFPANFKQKVIDVAVPEINAKTDITVSYEFIKTGRAYTDIEFIITPKADEEQLYVYKHIKKELDGQISLNGVDTGE